MMRHRRYLNARIRFICLFNYHKIEVTNKDKIIYRNDKMKNNLISNTEQVLLIMLIPTLQRILHVLQELVLLRFCYGHHINRKVKSILYGGDKIKSNA